MKKSTVLILMLGVLLPWSCQYSNEGVHSYDLLFEDEENSYAIGNEKELKLYAIEKLALPTDNSKELKEVEVENRSFEAGQYVLVKGRYFDANTNVWTSFVIPHKVVRGGKVARAECTMTCDGIGEEQPCEHIVYEPCKRQTCSCTNEKGSTCRAIVLF